MTENEVIKRLGLEPLTGEGGYFRRSYAGKVQDGKPAYSVIYYMETPDSFSHLHRLLTDEIYHFYLGDPVELCLISPEGGFRRVLLGQALADGMQVQYAVPAGWWQGSKLLPGGAWALLGTTMAPGYTDEDYTGADAQALCRQYPDLTDEIKRFV